MTYYGRYQHPDGRWMKWLKFPGQANARQHCLRMARGREIEILSEDKYNLKCGETPSPGAYERLIGKLEGSKSIEHLEESEDAGNSEEDSSQDQEERRGVGRPRVARPSKEILQELYISEKKSIRTIAKELGLSRDVIHSSLKEHGIETRSTFKESKLARYPLEHIKEKVRILGYSEAARLFGISLSALHFHVKTRR